MIWKKENKAVSFLAYGNYYEIYIQILKAKVFLKKWQWLAALCMVGGDTHWLWDRNNFYTTVLLDEDY